MGIKNFFSSLFGQADLNDQMPSSLGCGRQEEQDAVNLGANVRLSKDDVASSVKNEETKKPEESNKPEGNRTSEEDRKSEETDKPEESTDSEAQDKQEEETVASETYNLIILDESGSMSGVRQQTISGCNETLNSIRNMAKDQPGIKQYVSIFCFDNTNSRYLFKNVLVEETRDLTTDDYRPNGCTPLYDAIGYTVTQLQRHIAESDSVAVVTIITDGYENASRHWDYSSVIELIASLKKKGWVFTFIGANIDVEKTAKGLGIDSFVKFQQTDEGMNAMFEQERRSRRAYNRKRLYMESMSGFGSMPDEERKAMYGAMNRNYFVDEQRVAPEFITSLAENEIFVFGSNILGQHSGGAALYAKEHFGAEEGMSEGIQGRSYAIPTHGTTFKELKEAISRFTKYAVLHPQYKFMLTAVGCGAAGYSVEQIAPLFRHAYSFGNVYLPADFLQFIPKDFSF